MTLGLTPEAAFGGLLAAAGLLDGHAATLHWSVLADFAEEFPQVTATHDRDVLRGPAWNCGGAASSLDMMLALIGDRFGPAAAFAVPFFPASPR